MDITDSKALKVNMTYLIGLACTIALGTTHVSFALVGNNEIGEFYAAQMQWGDKSDYWNTRVSTMSIFGLTCGSVAAGFVLKYFARRTVIVMMSISAFVALVLTLFLNIWLILIGKFIYAFSAGVTLVASSMYLAETLP